MPGYLGVSGFGNTAIEISSLLLQFTQLLCCCCHKIITFVWKVFLADQRDQRKLKGVLSDRNLSLRTATTRKLDDMKEQETIAAKKAKKEDMEQRKQKQMERSEENMEEMFRKVSCDEIEDDLMDVCDSESLTLSQQSTGSGVKERRPARKGVYNRLELRYFSMECDRYCISDRAGAKLANGLLKDLGLVTKGNTQKLIDHSKLRRQRSKWGKVLEEDHKKIKMPPGIYADGKRCPTLVKEIRVTKLAVHGRRGRQASKIKTTTSNVIKVQEHLPVISEPGGKYMTHLTPPDGSGKTLAIELAAVIRERGIEAKVVGMDGCSVNTGVNNGAMRLLELDLGVPLQRVVCGLHLNELLWWHILSDTDGVTKGPKALSGPVGSTLQEDLWTLPTVLFSPVSGKVTELPEATSKDLSRDQNLAYQYCHAVQSGQMPEDLAGQVIGPLVTSRWLTCGVRTLSKFTRTKNPTKRLKRLVFVALNLYFPGWFRFRSNPHIQDGSKNFFYLIELSRSLEAQDRDITQNVLQYNAFWAHPENVTISMLADENEEVRRKAVNWIMKAREEFDDSSHPRQFVLPEVNFDAVDYCHMINWEAVDCTEPPLTVGMSMDDIMEAYKSPMILPDYPNHTQGVERAVRVVEQVAPKRVGYTARHRQILKLLKSREMVSSFNTKKDDAVF